MLKKSLLLTLLLALLVPWAVAQQTLPYNYGFEDNNLATDGWTSTGGAINSVAAYNSSSYGYRFSYSISSDVYLTSPILTGGTYGVNVSFYYKAYSGSYLDHFYVGYTTDETVTDPSAFTYGAMVTSSTSWQLYEEALPAGTVRVAIKYDEDNYDDGYYLYLDDFSFTAASSCATPTNLAVNYTAGDATATVTWDSEATNFNVDVNGTIATTNKTNYTFNVAIATTYNIKVQAVCTSEPSGWASTSFFSGCPTSFAIPYSYGFEDADAIDCWTLSSTNIFVDDQDPTFAHTGNNFLFFSYTTTPPQYAISPELSGIVNGLHVEFYYAQYTNGVETFQVGYSTTDNDPDSFTWDGEVTASTTYQRYSANYPAGTKYVAVKHTSDDQYYLFLDDFLFEESASCLEPTNVVASNETTTGATLNWTAGGEETMWDIYVTDDATVVPNDGTTPTVSNTSTKPYPLTGLTPATTYYAYVRAKCGAKEASAWSSPAIFNTDCVEKSLPYSYGFEDNEFDICWSIINTNTSYTAINIMDPTGSSGNHVLAFYRGSSTGTLVAVSPEISASYPLNGYQITFDACYANTSGGSMTAGKLGIGIMTDPGDFTTFQLIEEVDITDGFSTYGTHTVMFNNYTGSGHYIAIQDIHTQNGYVLVDNIEVTELPACLPPTDLAVDGGLQAVVSWTGSAASYDIAFSDDSTVDPETVIVGNTDQNSFELYKSVTLAAGDYTIWVRSNCGTDGTSDWVSTTLSLNYCTPNPTSHDGSGITGVSFGTGSYVVTNGDGSASLPASAPYYGDYTSMIGAIPAGVTSTIAITTSTGSYPYTFVIWVDLDNDFTFEDSEILYVGKASSGAGTLNATITIPATQALGDYRMRIYGADSYFNNFYNSGTPDYTKPHDPCSSGSYRHAHDYTIRVTEAPSCLVPSDLDADNITSTSADLSWTANSSEKEWTLYYKKTSATDYTEVLGVKDNPYPLTGLDPASNYVFYVVANCSDTETSDPSPEYTFQTSCEAITITDTDIYTEGFEDYTGTTYSSNGVIPACWTPYSTGGTTILPHVIGSGSYYYVHTGTNALTFYGYTNYAAMPEFTNDLSDLRIKFWMRTESANYGELKLGYITAADDGTFNTFTEIASYERSTTMVERITDLASVPAEATRLVFRWYYASQYSCCIDDITVMLIPSCMDPTDLHFTATTTNSATLAWTENGSATTWQICLNGDEEHPIDAPTNPFTVTSLTPSTLYTAKVRAVCSSSDQSAWSSEISFSTDCEAITITNATPYTQNFEAPVVTSTYNSNSGLEIPACWENPYNNGTNGYVYAKPHLIAAGTSYNYATTGQVLYFYGSGDDFVTLPEFTNDINSLMISFKWATEGSSQGTLKLGYITASDDGTYNTFTVIKSYNASSGDSYRQLKQEIVVLSAVPAEATRLVFCWTYSTWYGANIDDIEVSIPHTYTKTVNAYTGNGGYVLLSTPIDGIAPTDVTGMTNGDYDLYYFDQSQNGAEWRNYKDVANGGGYNLVSGKGYLYANKATTELVFTGAPYSGNGQVTLVKDDNSEGFVGGNLIGNPFDFDAYLVYGSSLLAHYKMNTAGDGFTTAVTTAIAPMEGVFVEATSDGQVVEFSKTAPTTSTGNLNISVAQAVTTRGANVSTDNAIVRFDGGNTLEKFSFRDSNVKVYIPQGNKDFAVVNAENEGEMPVNFKAAENGSYTISFNSENTTFRYLHLIDNMTGADIDLLETPSYTFDARYTDYASRFRLVFATGNNSNDSNFGFISDGNIIITDNTNATVQVIDALGRILVSENGVNSVSTTGMAPGVYVLRLINGNDVKTQKIVVK